ncbi:hypothetical protein [Arthrobacter sp. H14]|nr:hypothetical protein [Arthrobacter sp. H14]
MLNFVQQVRISDDAEAMRPAAVASLVEVVDHDELADEAGRREP